MIPMTWNSSFRQSVPTSNRLRRTVAPAEDEVSRGASMKWGSVAASGVAGGWGVVGAGKETMVVGDGWGTSTFAVGAHPAARAVKARTTGSNRFT